MTYLDSDESENEEISVRYMEHMGRAFKLVCTDPHGYWQILHSNNMPVKALRGSYTSLNEAQKAVKTLREEQLPTPQKRKVILTPKKKDNEEETED